jgi:hypothetical protein
MTEVREHATIGDILGKALHGETPTVDKLLARFNRQWEATAAECIQRAEELEGAAMDLRDRAKRLREAMELTAEVKGAVIYEINARNRVASLALVNPQEG